MNIKPKTLQSSITLSHIELAVYLKLLTSNPQGGARIFGSGGPAAFAAGPDALPGPRS